MFANEKLKCRDCSACRGAKGRYSQRTSFYCEHENQKHIEDYFRSHNSRAMPGFIGYSERFGTEPKRKNAPAWCPEKGKGLLLSGKEQKSDNDKR